MNMGGGSRNFTNQRSCGGRLSRHTGGAGVTIQSGELCAMADRPVLLRAWDNGDENILRPDAGVLAEQFCGPLEQRLLLFGGAGVEHDDPDVDDVVAAG